MVTPPHAAARDQVVFEASNVALDQDPHDQGDDQGEGGDGPVDEAEVCRGRHWVNESNGKLSQLFESVNAIAGPIQ